MLIYFYIRSYIFKYLIVYRRFYIFIYTNTQTFIYLYIAPPRTHKALISSISQVKPGREEIN